MKKVNKSLIILIAFVIIAICVCSITAVVKKQNEENSKITEVVEVKELMLLADKTYDDAISGVSNLETLKFEELVDILEEIESRDLKHISSTLDLNKDYYCYMLANSAHTFIEALVNSDSSFIRHSVEYREESEKYFKEFDLELSKMIK